MIAKAERYGVRDAELAAVINGFLVDIGLITDKDRTMILDRHTIRAQRKRYRRENCPNRTNMSGLYFDGKKDNTIQSDGTKKLEEHITVINEPGSHFITHTIPENASGESVAASIIESLGSEEMANIKVIGSDGTSCNNGTNKGVITRLESYLNRKLHWNVSFFINMSYILVICTK